MKNFILLVQLISRVYIFAEALYLILCGFLCVQVVARTANNVIVYDTKSTSAKYNARGR